MKGNLKVIKKCESKRYIMPSSEDRGQSNSKFVYRRLCGGSNEKPVAHVPPYKHLTVLISSHLNHECCKLLSALFSDIDGFSLRG